MQMAQGSNCMPRLGLYACMPSLAHAAAHALQNTCLLPCYPLVTEHSIFVGDLAPEVDEPYLLHFFQSYYSSVRSVKVRRAALSGEALSSQQAHRQWGSRWESGLVDADLQARVMMILELVWRYVLCLTVGLGTA